jgi:SAM-dependent methyltransferase
MSPLAGQESLPLTGERTVPGIVHENYWFQRHVAAYRLALRGCGGLRVLDAGCGEGYGTALLGTVAAEAVGIDLAPEVVAHACIAYPGVRFLVGDLSSLPLPDASVDAVVNLQVIEHLPDSGAFLDEVARVLVPGGRFWCATPNRLTFTPDSDAPVNPFHVKEFAPQELLAELRPRFRSVRLLGVHHGPRVRAIEVAARRSMSDLVLARPPGDWPRWLRMVVAAIRPGDFVVRPERVEASLDLLAVATAG